MCSRSLKIEDTEETGLQCVVMSGLDRLALFLQRHWLAVMVGLLLAYALLPFAAPLLMQAGLPSFAQVIYAPYKLTCHTFGFRSFFLFGEAFAYDRASFEQLSGINTATPQGLLAARDFLGNAQMGYKVALCQRDVAIYSAMGLNGMVYGAMRGRARPLPWALFVLIGVLPIGLDGLSQLLSQPPFQLLPYRESNWALRLVTGSLFGTSVAWLVFPMLDGMVSAPAVVPTSVHPSAKSVLK